MTTTAMTTGDKLDVIFAEVEELKVKMVPLEREMNRIMYTPTGRVRKLNGAKLARMDELEAQYKPLLARFNNLGRQATAVVRAAA